MTTFADLGIDFPLFTGPVDDASGWAPKGFCALCEAERAGFALIGGVVIVTCERCGSSTAVSVNGSDDACVACGHANALVSALRDRHGCWKCLREGRWSHTMNTEAGMVRWVDAMAGRTFGVPTEEPVTAFAIGAEGAEPVALATPDRKLAGFPATPVDDDGWMGAIVPSELLFELTRTPSYETWQGESWLFHCMTAMTYVGRWGRSEFNAATPEADGKAFAREVAFVESDLWDYGLGDSADASRVGVYMFRCSSCQAVRGHCDST